NILNDMQRNRDVVDTGAMKMSNISSPNPFVVLGVDEDEDEENIRGLNRAPKQKEVCQVVNENNLSICAILESHVDVAVVYDTCKKNDDIMDVIIMAQTNQVMHVQINIRADNKVLFCSFIYADNYYVDRRALWNNLDAHASLMRDKPWVLLGYFNAALNLEDHSCGGYEPNIAMREFKEFQPYRISDHSPCVLRILKGLKTPFRKLLHDQGNLHDRVNRLRVELDEAQKAIDRNPSCSLLRDEHAHYLMAFKESSLDEESFLRQKSKIEWLNAGDSNTAYFNKIVKSKCARNRIEIVQDSSNVRHEGNAVASAFVSHYEQFLGIEGTTTPLDDHGLSFRLLSDHKAEFMVREVSNSEIKGALFSMGNAKAPGPDGFTTAFFKKSWDIVGGEMTIAIRDFFTNGTLPVRYLDVPLISSRLLYRDCKGKAKVAWEAVCLPQREGGLGIRRIEDFNIALMATHIWCILINKESLWVQWIHSYKLQGRSFWDVPCLGDVSWGWRKLLQIRPHVRPFIWHKINNGRSTSMLFDKWADPCPLCDMLTVRNIVRSDISLSDTKKMHFLLSSMSVVYVLTTPILEDGGDDATVEQIRKRAKWDNDNYVYIGLILKGMSDPLFDIYQNVESGKELSDSLEAKYMADDA
ncbi:sodium/hydrogen exchanger 6, partial [Tanacetum coccineum]